MLNCCVCGRPIARGYEWHLVVGWEHYRKDGGPDRLKQRTGLYRVAHGSCAEVTRPDVALDLEHALGGYCRAQNAGLV